MAFYIKFLLKIGSIAKSFLQFYLMYVCVFLSKFYKLQTHVRLARKPGDKNPFAESYLFK